MTKCPLHDKLWNGFRPELDWSVACTLPRREVGAGARLVELGFAVYLPMWTKRASRRRQEPREPLFPGYLFVHLNGSAKRPQDVEAVSRLMLAPGGGIARIAGADLAWLYDLEQSGQLAERARSIANDPHGVGKLPPGTKLQALSGPFAGFPCELQSTDGLERCKVLFAIFGRATAVEMPLEKLRAAG